MKIKAFASNRKGDVRDGVGCITLTAMGEEDVRFLTRLNEALKRGEAIEFPAMETRFYCNEMDEGAELVGNNPAETIGAGVDDALAASPDRAGDAAARDDDAEVFHG